jgi:hypothetical protein
MTSRFVPLRPGLVFTLGIGLAGCVSDGARHGSTPGRRPVMPTVGLSSPRSPAAGVSDDEVLATTLRAARARNEAEVVRALKSLEDPARRARIATDMITELAAEDPRSAAAVAVPLATELQQAAVVDLAGRGLARRDPEFALRWAADLAADHGRDPRAAQSVASHRMSRAVVDELVSLNPGNAFNRIAALPAGATRDDFQVLAAAAWARRDPDAAINWLSELPADELKPRLTSSVGFEVAQLRPERAVEVAEMLPAGRDRWLLFSAIAQTWVAVDSKAAVAWAGKLPAGEARDAAFAGVDTGFGVPARRRLAGAPGTRGGSSRTRGGGAAVAAAFPEINSPGFAAWLAANGAGMSRDEALLEYIRQRAALEPAAIGPLISALPPGHMRDQAMNTYVDGLLLGSPFEAARWVQSLPRSERTDELVEKTARRWLQSSPDAAAEWLDRTTLPPHRKEWLLREAGR